MATKDRNGGPRGTKSGRLADFVGTMLDPALRRRGFQTADILARWPEIVGDRLAANTLPEKLAWPRRVSEAGEEAMAEPATLVLRVDGPAAIEIQHMAPQILERLNVYFGYRAVGKLRIVQAPLPTREPVRPAARQCPAEAAAHVDDLLAGIPDTPLKQALRRLGRNVAADRSAARAVKKA